MAKAEQKPQEHATEDFGVCEYVPFGADAKIKLSFGLILKWLDVKTSSGAVPSDQDLMKFLMTCKARKLNPFDGDAFLIGYDGKNGPVFSTVVAHQALLKRAETHPEFDGMESGVIVQVGDTLKELVGDFFPQGAKLVGGWATVFFVNRRHPMTKRLKLSTFDKGRSLWKTNPEGMIVKCAEADALRSSFPQLIAGMYLREEMEAQRLDVAHDRQNRLTDGRGNEIPSPFVNGARERAFVDSAGGPLIGTGVNHNGCDPDAEEAAAAVRWAPTPVGAEAWRNGEQPEPDAEGEYTIGDDIYHAYLSRCRAIKSKQEAFVLKNEIKARREARDISEEYAEDLASVIDEELRNLRLTI